MTELAGIRALVTGATIADERLAGRLRYHDGERVFAAVVQFVRVREPLSSRRPLTHQRLEAGHREVELLWDRNPGLQLIGVDSIYQVLITGILVILAVTVDQLSRHATR